MPEKFKEKNPYNDNKNPLMLFATERVEDYVVLSLALAILILIMLIY